MRIVGPPLEEIEESAKIESTEIESGAKEEEVLKAEVFVKEVI